MSKFSVDLETLYEETNNPLFVMVALADYQICPESKPLPKWIMNYLRDAAMQVEMLADTEQPSVALRRVNVALGLTGNGRNNSFEEYKQILRAENAAWVDDNRKELFVHPSGKPEKAAVARDWFIKAAPIPPDISHKTVGNWVRKLKGLREAQKRKETRGI
jgi:hypothetical protein